MQNVRSLELLCHVLFGCHVRFKRQNLMAGLLVICCLAGLLRGADASQGDRDAAFQSCVSSCQAEGCVRLPVDKQAKLGSNSIACDAACPERNGLEVPWALQAMRWSCADDCKCVHLS